MRRAANFAWLSIVLLMLSLPGFARGQYIGVPDPGPIAPAPDSPESSALLEEEPELPPHVHPEDTWQTPLDFFPLLDAPSSEIQEHQSGSDDDFTLRASFNGIDGPLGYPLWSWIACSIFPSQSSLSSDETQRVSQVTSPPPAPVPPNASRVTATVLKHSVWPPASPQGTMPLIPPDLTLYSFVLEIHTSDPENPASDSLARPGIVVEAFSSEVLASDLVGKKITATLKLTGDTRGVRWWITNVQVLP